MDLQFPHHENEIAQSEGATGTCFVNFWMHNGFVRINEEKMSKSLGNFFTVREVLERYRGEVIRFFILSSQYRSPLNYSDDQLDVAAASLNRLYTSLRGFDLAAESKHQESGYRSRFNIAMEDDFNTPVAMSVLFELAREINRSRPEDPIAASRMADLLKELGGVLGILQEDPEQYLKSGSALSVGLSDDDVVKLVQRRLDARQDKNWMEADKIRNELKEQGVILEDGAGSTTWRRG